MIPMPASEKVPIKNAMYAYRVLLTGIHLMKSGEVVTDVRQLHHDAWS